MLSDDLCLCIDNDKRALFSSAFGLKHLNTATKNLIYYHHNMNDHLKELLYQVQQATRLPLVVLFQHPSPSNDSKSRGNLFGAIDACIKSLLSGVIVGIHFIFDCRPNYLSSGKCWNKMELECHIRSTYQSELMQFTCKETKKICEYGETMIEHPTFGFVERKGWALMKKGEEYCFCISK